jgi:blue light- and temperature-responsive anti-repressor
MHSPLHRLIYYSKNLIPGPGPAIESEIRDILAVSRKNNAAHGITGALIFNAGIFAQVLEGSRRDVEATFERIQRDNRHDDVQVLDFAPAEARGFANWSMGFLGSSAEGRRVFDDIGRHTGFDAKRLAGERVFEVMHRIALESEGIAGRRAV